MGSNPTRPTKPGLGLQVLAGKGDRSAIAKNGGKEACSAALRALSRGACWLWAADWDLQLPARAYDQRTRFMKAATCPRGHMELQITWFLGKISRRTTLSALSDCRCSDVGGEPHFKPAVLSRLPDCLFHQTYIAPGVAFDKACSRVARLERGR